jgi:hypothetical protein
MFIFRLCSISFPVPDFVVNADLAMRLVPRQVTARTLRGFIWQMLTMTSHFFFV